MGDFMMVHKILDMSKGHAGTILTNVMFLLYLTVIFFKSRDKTAHNNILGKINALLIKVVKLEEEQEKFSKFFSVRTTNDEHIAKLHEIKKHYLGKFEVEKVCLFARFKADTFIEKIESLINEGDMGIGKLDDTLFTLRSLSEIIKTEMEQRFDHPFVAKFREIHSKQFDQYLFIVERELSSFENHHKEKFLIASTEFIKSFLTNLKLIEYLAEI